MPTDQRGPIGRLQDRGQDAQCCGFPGTVRPQQSVDAARLTPKTDVIDRANLSAFLVVEALGQAPSLDHQRTLATFLEPTSFATLQSTTRNWSVQGKSRGFVDD